MHQAGERLPQGAATQQNSARICAAPPTDAVAATAALAAAQHHRCAAYALGLAHNNVHERRIGRISRAAAAAAAVAAAFCTAQQACREGLPALGALRHRFVVWGGHCHDPV